MRIVSVCCPEQSLISQDTPDLKRCAAAPPIAISVSAWDSKHKSDANDGQTNRGCYQLVVTQNMFHLLVNV